jgi:hypothetical protein
VTNFGRATKRYKKGSQPQKGTKITKERIKLRVQALACFLNNQYVPFVA